MRRYAQVALLFPVLLTTLIGCSMIGDDVDEGDPVIGTWKYDPPLVQETWLSYYYLMINEDNTASILVRIPKYGVNRYVTFDVSYGDGSLNYFDNSDAYVLTDNNNTLCFTATGLELTRSNDHTSVDTWVIPLTIDHIDTAEYGYFGLTPMMTDGQSFVFVDERHNMNITRLSMDGDSLSVIPAPFPCRSESGTGATYGGGKYWLILDTNIYNFDPVTGDTVNTGVQLERYLHPYALAYDDGTLWAMAWWGDFVQIDLSDGHFIKEFEYLPNIIDFAMAGDKLIASGVLNGEVYEIDTNTGLVCKTMVIDPSQQNEGITYANGFLYVVLQQRHIAAIEFPVE